MAYVDFPEGLQGQKQRKKFWLSEEGLTLIAGWRRNGIPIKDVIANYIGVSPTGFYGWYRESEDLRKACVVSAEIANSSVENALYRRAVGYDYWEEQWEMVEGQLVLVKKFKKHLPPDTKAILHWLFNRMPTVWRSIQEPLESTQYTETIKNIVVAMKQVAETGKEKVVPNADQLSTDT